MILSRWMWALTAVSLLLGAVHLGLSFTATQKAWNLSVLWFGGSGLAIFLAGLLNLVALKIGSADPLFTAILILGNGAMAGFFLLAWSLLPQPQVLVGLATFSLLALGSLLIRLPAR